MKILATLLVVSTLCSCAHSQPSSTMPAVDGAAVARSIKLCSTSFDDLQHVLGRPTRDGILHDRRIVSWIVSESGVVHYLAVLLDAKGVVTDVYWDIPTEIPWTPADQCSAR